MKAKPLSTCTPELLGVDQRHALVYGRTRMWPTGALAELLDGREPRAGGPKWWWSRTTWLKAMWYPHRGPPSSPAAWGVICGQGMGCFTGPGDADISHWLPVPADPPDSDIPKES